MKLELKGIITQGRNESLTCCYIVNDLNIGEQSLFDALDEHFAMNPEGLYNGGTEKEISPSVAVRYVILDTPPDKDVSFEQQSAEVVLQMLYAEYFSGCYSEYTCGLGDFDYFINEDRSIFQELASYVGKYIHIVI